MMEERRKMSWLNCKDGASRRRQQTDLPLSTGLDQLSQISRYAVGLEGTRCIKKQKSETAWRRKGRFLGVGSEYTLCNKTKQRGFEVEREYRREVPRCQLPNPIRTLTP